jgi:hypothetical protein
MISTIVLLGLAGCAQTPPTLSTDTLTKNQLPSTPASTNYPKPSKIQGVTSPDTTDGMTNNRFFVVVTKKEVEIVDLQGIAQRISARVGAIETNLMPEIKGFTLKTPGSVLTSDILRDSDVKFVIFGNGLYTPPAVNNKTVAKPTKDKKSTAKSKTSSKKSTKNTKQTKTKTKKKNK